MVRSTPFLPAPMSSSKAAEVLASTEPPPTLDIEHVAVKDDPRLWSESRKYLTLAIVAGGGLIAGLAGNIQNPAIEEIENALNASSAQISWTISLFILVQGVAPLFWTAVSEIFGRKIVYIVSLTIFCASSVVVATSRTIELLIAFRAIQAAGSSSVMAIGAATLSDCYDPHERGTKMGLYYIAPLLGPALAPILGGGLTTGFNWRAPFWLLVIISGLSVLQFVFLFKETFRKERSLTYQKILKERMKERETKRMKERRSLGLDVRSATAEEPANRERDLEAASIALNEIKLSFSDVNPFTPMWGVLKRWHNLLTLIASGLLEPAYGYNPLKIGLMLLPFGFGCVVGSLAGGRWSDIQLARLRSPITAGGLLVPFSACSYGWVTQCVMLFLSGFGVVWMYSSTLAYIVDSNVGRSGTATACNSMFRGAGAFVAIEIAVPLQDALGDGWLYTIWAGLLVVSTIMLLIVMVHGRKWRTALEIEQREQAKSLQ
ncbi:vacuolar DHA amino acid exporter [Flagelloscypha sp. PMI_526]|nr:vacuolar DHA amino acid exporter [Flagelloscypha sp. PMI_526]